MVRRNITAVAAIITGTKKPDAFIVKPVVVGIGVEENEAQNTKQTNPKTALKSNWSVRRRFFLICVRLAHAI